MAPAEKQLGFSSPMEVMPPSQVVFLQPMVSSGRSSSPKAGSENVRQSKSYMPILKSYPKIAPHPADLPTKRMGSSKMKGSSASVYNQRQKRPRHNPSHRHRHNHNHSHSHRLYSSPSPQPPVKPISNFEASKIQSQVALSQSVTDSSPFLLEESLPPYTDDLRTEVDSDDQVPFSVDSDKQTRFSNTYNILNKSGLLGITMRTKQLIKENKRTQGQLQQLQEQTGLLLEALSSGDPQLWSKLQLSLQHTDKEQWGAKAQGVLG